MNKNYWQVKKSGVTIAHGSEATFPDAKLRKQLRSAGYSIYVNGKLYRQ